MPPRTSAHQNSDAFLSGLGQFAIDRIDRGHGAPDSAVVEAYMAGFDAGFEYGRQS